VQASFADLTSCNRFKKLFDAVSTPTQLLIAPILDFMSDCIYVSNIRLIGASWLAYWYGAFLLRCVI